MSRRSAITLARKSPMLRHSGGTGPFSFKKKQGPPPCGRNRDGCFMKPQVVPPDDSRKRLLGKHAVAPSASPSRNEGNGAGYLKIINRAGPSQIGRASCRERGWK